MKKKDIKVVISFRRIGPYHVARISAAAALYPGLVALESTATDSVYAWDTVEIGLPFKKHTIFRDKDSLLATTKEVRTAVWSALDEIRPDIVFIHGWSEKAAFAQLEWCIKNRVPRVVMSESQEIDASRNIVVETVKSAYVRSFNAALCGGASHAQYLGKLGLPVDKVFSGYDVVDNDYYSAGATRALADEVKNRERLGLPEKYFLSSNRFTEKKNLFRLLEAYDTYRKKAGRDAWQLVLLGDGELKQQIIERVEQLGLRDHVLMPGFQQYDVLPAYYALAGAFVHASTTEQWGLVVNEAMASGLPVLVSDRCGCAGELVDEGVNGYSFDPYNVAQIADQMSLVSSSLEHASKLGENSKKIIVNWSTARFGQAVECAVSAAFETGNMDIGLLQKIAIKSMYLK
ncbi:MAG: hypothetical protein DRR42_08835 [Gammaproteobacteria bacterium]|nr:MAG: hypothetical protein DRR42_08835 [Gammaproteobacteria bacterium]